MTTRRRRKKKPGAKEDHILRTFQEAARPLLAEELLRLLKVGPDQAGAVTAAVDQLVARGQLVSLKGGRFGLAEKMNLVVGELSVHPDGFGFVTPETGGQDIYLVAANLKEAWHGDRVVVRIEGSRGRRREGRVIRILDRRLKEVLGTLCQAEDTYYVEPEDEHLIFNLVIAPEHLDGAAPGQMVRAAVTHYPTGHLNPQGVVIEVLGAVEDAEVQTRLVILKYGLPDEFPPEVLAEADKIDPDLSARVLKDRLDLRELPMVTIDGETARDFDDGVCVEKKPGGTFTLYVSIADVSHYVTPGSPLDQEADLRGTSVYFPQRAVHMLPENLATDVCSLKPDEDRLAVIVILDYDRQGRRKDFTFARSVVRNHARLTYRLVHDLLDRKRPATPEPLPAFPQDAQPDDGALRPPPGAPGRAGQPAHEHPRGRGGAGRAGLAGGHPPGGSLLSHQIIEEFMIAANEAVAIFLGEPSLLRVHEPPDPAKMAVFRGFLKSLGFVLPKEAHRDPRVLREFLEEVRKTPLAPMVLLMLLRSLKQARYAGEALGHYGLATEWYTHFTSPIRRYPDLIVHRLLLAKLAGKKPPVSLEPDDLETKANHLNKRERAGVEAEREMLARMQVRFLSHRVGETFSGRVTGVNAFGFFVALDEVFAEGLVRLVDLPNDYYRYDEVRMRLIGRRTRRSFALGDQVTGQGGPRGHPPPPRQPGAGGKGRRGKKRGKRE